MKFTLSWLKEHLDTDEPVEKLADKLTMIGLEVESIDDKARALAPFTIARVISAERHPNADRLRVGMVDPGNGAAPVQVVCGAPNARAGLNSVFSAPGTFIPGKNITLGVGTIRGVESRGMLCSEAELQLSENHDGIMELPADAPVGAPYAQWAGLGDPVFEINLTPNRQDCTGVSGIARDLSAADMGKFKDAGIKPIKGEFPCPVKVTVEDTGLWPGVVLRLGRGVKNGPSPDWMQQRLMSIGLRPINALVDITNFMTYDRARPLHVFDAAKVSGSLTVRRARDGETLLALDGRSYALDNTMCVIADDHGVESLAGIMGGEASGCSEQTTDVLIESALWNEINVAQTGRKLGINSDARYRFERGVDPAFMVPGLEMATRLVMETCGGTPSENVVVGKAFGDDRVIDFTLSEVRRLAGMVVAVTWSFIARPAAELFGGGESELALANPIASDQSDMRPSLLPGLVAAVQANIDRGFPDLALFEVGQVFKGDRPEDQLIAASGVRHGFASSNGIGRHWLGTPSADALDAKADAFAVLAAAGAPMQAMQVVPGGPNWLHPGRSGTIQIGPQNVLGHFGELHPRTLNALGAEGPVIAFEVILDRIPDAKPKPTRAKPRLELSPFQPVSRDFAFIVDRGVKADDIVRAAQGADRKLVTDVTVFDVYEGRGIDEDRKSIAIAVTIQPREKTLTDQEIEAVAAKIVADVTKKTGGALRG